MDLQIGLENQTDKEYLKRILNALNEVKKRDRTPFYETYKAELITRIEQLQLDDDNDIMKADFFMGEI